MLNYIEQAAVPGLGQGFCRMVALSMGTHAPARPRTFAQYNAMMSDVKINADVNHYYVLQLI